MLKWLSSRIRNNDVSDHPLGSEDGIEAYLASVPAGDPERVLLEFHEWLGDVEHLESQLRNDEAFIRAVDALEAAAYPSLRKCWTKLLDELRENGSAARLVEGLQNYLLGAHASLRRAMALLQARGEGEERMALLLLRCVMLWNGVKRLKVLHYRPVDASWWREMHALLQEANRLGSTREALRPYSDTRRESVWHEYFSTLLFEGGPLGGLSPDEIDAVDRMARWIEPHAQYLEQPSQATPYCIVPVGGNMPERRREHASYDVAARFFGAGAGVQQLLQLKLMLARDGKVPEWLEESPCDRERLQHLVEVLINHWGGTAPQRRYRRHKVNGALYVVHGLDMIRRMVAASEFALSGRSLDYDSFIHDLRKRWLVGDLPKDLPPPPKTPMDVLRLLETSGVRQMMDSWELVDVSAQGMGVQFQMRRPWMRIGALVGYRWEEELEWRIGVIRRMGQLNGRPSAGLLLFEGVPKCSQIRRAGSDSTGGVWHQQTKETSGLGWVDAVLLHEGGRRLLVPPGYFEKGQAVNISLGGKWRAAKIDADDAHEDYSLLDFAQSEG